MTIPHNNGDNYTPLKVLIIGAGLGGLACAIACLQQGLAVTVLEKAEEIGEVGAGIQVPPNAVRIMDGLGLVSDLIKANAVKLEHTFLRRYADGHVIAVRPGDEWLHRHFGYSWYVIHRADYHRLFLNEAKRLGAKVCLGATVISVDTEEPCAILASGDSVDADVIIGADGLRSVVRDAVLGYHVDPVETGDLAYRATISRDRIEALNEPSLLQSCSQAWIGPQRHVVFYPLRNMKTFNLVLLCPDDLPPGVATKQGDIQEMRNLFQGWDPRLTALIAQVDNVLKWKICHMKELDTWCKGRVALLGDACHPSLPYQAQGAAMAVEDGAALGVLLGKLSKARLDHDKIPEILALYELARKQRTTVNVRGAVENRGFFHMPDGPEADARNAAFAKHDWDDPTVDFAYLFGNLKYLKSLMGFDTTSAAERLFEEWRANAYS